MNGNEPMTDMLDYINNLFPNESKFYNNGKKKPKFRDRIERICSCRSEIGRGFDTLSQTTRTIYERPCGIVDPGPDGDLPVCEKCVFYRREKRIREFSDRIDRAINEGETLFVIYSHNKKEMQNIQKAAIKNGYTYIGLPTENKDERVVVLNGEISGSIITPEREIKEIIHQLAGVVGRGRVSGKLGLSSDVPLEKTLPVPNVFYSYDKSIVNGSVFASIEAKAIFATSNMPMDSDSDLLELIKKRHGIIIGMLRKHDPEAKMILLDEVMVNPAELRKNIYVKKLKEFGAKRMLEPETRDAMDQMQEEVFGYDIEREQEKDLDDSLMALGFFQLVAD